MTTPKIAQPIPLHPQNLDDSTYYLNRELSLLQFFRRVLAMSADEQIPTLERLRFLTICSTISDEFFEIRVAGIKQRIELGISQVRPDGLGQNELLERLGQTVSDMVETQYAILNQDVLPALRESGIKILRRHEWKAKQKKWLRTHFEELVEPVLTPVALDPVHPFPRPVNKSLNMIVSLEGTDAFGRSSEYAILPVPRCLPRLIQLPRDIGEGEHTFVLLSSIVHAHVDQVFPGMTVRGCHQFRVTRNADLWVDEEEVEDLVDALKGELFRRRFGDAVRLEVASTCPKKDVALLCAQFGLSDGDVYRVDGPVNLPRLEAIYGMVERSDLKFEAYLPSRSQVAPNSDLFEMIGRTDILLHHPFESFSPVVDLVRQAAEDPDVLAIKQTLYRTGADSPFAAALVKAARSGKEVTAVVELRARFDEKANIDLATRLQNAGAHVVYGIVGYKTHAKMLMVVRREGTKLRRYVHLGTGNYHTGTAKAYTDISLMTARKSITRDVHNLFMQLTGVGRAEELETMLQSPSTLQDWLVERLEFESAEAKAGRKAGVIIKINSLSDPAMIKALYRASQAGVDIQLIVRGICCLKPGIPGVSDRIKVRSVVGRFLEHTRIFYFYAGGEDLVYAASADWMIRNLYRRVEACFPISSTPLKQRVLEEALHPYLVDTAGAWALGHDGAYTRVLDADSGSGRLSAHRYLLKRLCEKVIGSRTKKTGGARP
jgi:polyphosphate kinase